MWSKDPAKIHITRKQLYVTLGLRLNDKYLVALDGGMAIPGPQPG